MDEEEKKQEGTSTPEESVVKDPVSEEKDIQDNKMWALLSYLGVLVVLPLIMKTDSPFAQFHAKQGTLLLIVWMLSWLPFGPIFGIAAFVFSIIGIVNVLNGEKKKLPIIGDLAEKIKL